MINSNPPTDGEGGVFSSTCRTVPEFGKSAPHTFTMSIKHIKGNKMDRKHRHYNGPLTKFFSYIRILLYASKYNQHSKINNLNSTTVQTALFNIAVYLRL
jgi:hypothetical protein